MVRNYSVIYLVRQLRPLHGACADICCKLFCVYAVMPAAGRCAGNRYANCKLVVQDLIFFFARALKIALGATKYFSAELK